VAFSTIVSISFRMQQPLFRTYSERVFCEEKVSFEKEKRF